MSAADLTPLYICAALSGFALAISHRQRRKQRLLSDLPTSKTQGVFIGLVELCGTAESEAPLRSFLSEAPSVHYAYSIEEEWSRTVRETYTDKDGKPQTRTRHEHGWSSVDRDGETQDFYLQDDTGIVLVRPDGARLEPSIVFDETVTRSDPLYYGKGPSHAVSDSCHRRRFIEHAIPLHAALYVVGQARERKDIVAAEIAASREAPLFLVSTRTEKSVQRSHSVWSWFCWIVGLGFAAGAAFTLPSKDPLVFVVAIAAYLIVWAGTWAWMVFNSLIGLRARVRQAWSLIDVQLKRRHDLIPSLVAIVQQASAHERSTQAAISALRAQLTATPPDAAGPNFAGVASELRIVLEENPTLKAQAGFSKLHATLVETEQRIALARTYYNDIATQLATRLERIPDRWVGKLAGLKPEPLLAAANFERAPVAVELAGAT